MEDKIPNHNCIICGIPYHCCDKCDKTNNWRSVACSVEHYQIFNVIEMHRNGIMNKDEVLDILNDWCVKSIDDCKNFKLEVYEYLKVFFKEEIVVKAVKSTAKKSKTVEII